MALQAVNRGESLSDRAYRMLRNAILSGELAPGEPLTEESLAERLQISRTPIRTALHRLVSEGLAETACGKGISVREVGDGMCVRLTRFVRSSNLSPLPSVRRGDFPPVRSRNCADTAKPSSRRPHGAGCGIIFITEISFIFGWPNARATISWLR